MVQRLEFLLIILLFYWHAQKQAPVFKISKVLLHTHRLSLIYLEIFMNQNKNYILMIRKDQCFCGKNVQSIAILHEKLIIFIKQFPCNIPFGCSFLAIQNVLKFCKCSKTCNGLKYYWNE